MALVVSLYCNLFPSPDVPLSKHGNVRPRNPHINISSGRYMLTQATADRSDRDGDTIFGDWRAGEEGKGKKSRQT